jgi:molybdenum cofactor biosynthesis enzyme MoaA
MAKSLYVTSVVVMLCLWIAIRNGIVCLIGMTQRKIMESAKTIKLPKNPTCNVCNKKARIYSDGNWWCCLNAEMGEFNSSGFCKEKKK